MKPGSLCLFIRLLLLSGLPALSAAQTRVDRPPAIPLIACDPYFSIWSTADTLSADWSRHWTGSTMGMAGLVRIDGKTYRVMGKSPSSATALRQVRVTALPTRTIYEFEGSGVRLNLTFMTPSLPADIKAVSEPVAYLTWTVRSTDGGEHRVAVYFDVSAEAVVNTPDQDVTWSRYRQGGLDILRMGSREQPVLARAGDDLRIDWGYLYLASPSARPNAALLSDDRSARDAFMNAGALPDTDDMRCPRPADDHWPVMAHAFDFGTVSANPLSHFIVLAYDDLFSIQYFFRNLRPYWRRDGAGAADLLAEAFRDYDRRVAACTAFDDKLMTTCRRAGGEDYALIASLAFRQCLAANKIVADIDGTPLMFPKENFSNGCIGTVDVIYPASPFFLLFNPSLLRAQLKPVLDYAGLPRWKFPYAPHDLGTYPLANGQAYGGGEKTEEYQMPVEESGNMLLMAAGIAVREGNAAFPEAYWPTLTKWAEYLKAKGLDPENQLCTDDFAGHLAHNANLSLKAILALGSYAKLCEMTGRRAEATAYWTTAREFAVKWRAMADDGDHFRLAFDKPGTWSQKYNLVWDQILGLNLFPAEVRQKEIMFYLSHQKPFGLPLDSRKDYTKLDWTVWTASLSSSTKDFESFMAPLAAFVNRTPERVPMTDWFWTTDARQAGFQARSVVGGVFVKLLMERERFDD